MDRDDHGRAGAARRVVDRAEDLLDEHTRPAHPRKYATSDEPATVADLRDEQYRETERQWQAPGPIPVMTEAQGHGIWMGGIGGGLVGAALFWPVGFIGWDSVALGWRILVCAIIGALAGGAVGAVYFGGRLPELEGETTGAHNQAEDGTTLADPGTDERGRTHHRTHA